MSIATFNARHVNWTRHPRGLKERRALEILLDDIEKCGVIEPSKSLWLNPIVFTLKKIRAKRFKVDFRKLNESVLSEDFELP